MSEQTIIAKSAYPQTKISLIDAFHCIGVRKGSVVFLHSSLSSIGWVCGGARTVIEAMLSTLEESGTLVMPAHSADLSDPQDWENPPVPKSWVEPIKNNMPAFDRILTPTYGMGMISEAFRLWPNVCRSYHPQHSICALGPRAEEITSNQPLEDAHGESSPLAKLYKADASILLLGVGFDCCTSLHLAEIRAQPFRKKETSSAPMTIDGRRIWKRFETYPVEIEDFSLVGEHLLECGIVETGLIGLAKSYFMPIRSVVDESTEWFIQNRPSV